MEGAGMITWVFYRIGYWIRPYDTLADRRRWFWQPRTRCAPIVLDEAQSEWPQPSWAVEYWASNPRRDEWKVTE